MTLSQPSSPWAKRKEWVSVVGLVLVYSVCNSMLLVLNKMAVTRVPAPSVILLAQLWSCTVSIYLLKLINVVRFGDVSAGKIRSFGIIAVGFIAVLYCNMTTLKYVPVDTVICARASMPLVIAVIEYMLLGRELPSLRSWLALSGVFAGVLAYAWNDDHFTLAGYTWLGIWFSISVAEIVWIKKVIQSVDMTNWERSFYQNAMAVPLILVLALCSGETGVAAMSILDRRAWPPIAASCLAGVGLSYFSFALCESVSATTFTVIGNVCKVLSILVNVLMANQHSNLRGMAGLLLCISAGSLYKQPPMRKKQETQDMDQQRSPTLPKHARLSPENNAHMILPPRASYQNRSSQSRSIGVASGSSKQHMRVSIPQEIHGVAGPVHDRSRRLLLFRDVHFYMPSKHG